MKVRLHLDGKAFFSEEDWSTVHQAFEFYIKEYKLDVYNYNVYVKFPSEIEPMNSGEFTRGYCMTQFYDDRGKLKPLRFIIKISNKSSMNKILEVIFHEMTHVMQELRGDFQRLRDGSEIYQGTHYSVDILTKPTYKQYRNFPWEVEAREVASSMLKKWNEAHGIKESFWTKLINFWR